MDELLLIHILPFVFLELLIHRLFQLILLQLMKKLYPMLIQLQYLIFSAKVIRMFLLSFLF